MAHDRSFSFSKGRRCCFRQYPRAVFHEGVAPDRKCSSEKSMRFSVAHSSVNERTTLAATERNCGPASIAAVITGEQIIGDLLVFIIRTERRTERSNAGGAIPVVASQVCFVSHQRDLLHVNTSSTVGVSTCASGVHQERLQ